MRLSVFVLLVAVAMAEAKEAFSPKKVKQHPTLPITLVSFEEVDSTQTWAERNLKNLVSSHQFSAEHWTSVAARRQTSGLGTYDSAKHEQRSWISEVGNVYVTFVVPWPESQRDKLVNFAQVGTYAVAKTLEGYGVSPQIKWINDVLIRDQKVAGVLSTAPAVHFSLVGREAPSFVPILLGIGINVSSDTQSKRLDQTTHLEREMDVALQCPAGENHKRARLELVDDVLANLTVEVFEAFNKLKSDGFRSFHDYVDERLVWKGHSVLVDTDTEKVEGIFIGVDSQGMAKLKTASGKERLFNVGHMILKLE